MISRIHESNLIEGIDDKVEDNISLGAWRWLISQDTINEDKIKLLQAKIVINQDIPAKYKGQYRDCNVIVDGRKCPKPEDVPNLMKMWLESFRYGTTPLTQHIVFERIHPFFDGNGRTGRMLLWWEQHATGEQLAFYTAKDKEEYFKLFRE